MFLVIANISKRCNIRSLIASAVAFGAEVLVGMYAPLHHARAGANVSCVFVSLLLRRSIVHSYNTKGCCCKGVVEGFLLAKT